MIRRPPRSTRVRSSAASDVYKRQILIAANDIAKKPKILEVLNIVSEFPAKPAIIAPTIITDEIALVTDIKGV